MHTIHITLFLCLGAVLTSALDIYNYERLFGLSDIEAEEKYICADIVFALDRSCSIIPEDRLKMITIVESVVKGSKTSGGTRFALLTFGYHAKLEFGFGEFSTRAALLAKLAELRTTIVTKQDKCKTYTWEVLEMVRNTSSLLGTEPRYDQKTGHERGRVLILMTDGVPYSDDNRLSYVSIKCFMKSREEKKQLTIEEGNKNTNVGIETMVVQLPNKKEKNDPSQDAAFKDLFRALVTKLRWYIQVSPSENLEEVGKFFFGDLVKEFPCSYRCLKKIDLCFVLDRSISIKTEDIGKAKDFFKELADSFMITYDDNAAIHWQNAMIGVISYNAWVYKHVLGYECRDNDCVRRAIEAIPTTHDNYTETDDALEYVLNTCLSVSNTRGGGIPAVNMFATDGNTWERGTNYINSAKTLKVADRLKKNGIETAVAGMPNYREVTGIEEWKGISTNFIFDLRVNPDSPFIPNFDDLKAITGTVARLLCEKYGVE